MRNDTETEWSPYLQRYVDGEWRAPIFRDLILADAQKQGDRALTFLDIGCGGGFDGEVPLRASLAEAATEYVGIEPDTEIELEPIFSATHRCPFEEAPIPPNSVDIAFAVMVLEHVVDPKAFWDKIQTILRPGGVFWGFTVDARHWFVAASLLMEKLHIKDLYLNLLLGKRGDERYENYGVYYRSNTPKQITQLTQAFSTTAVLNFRRVGQCDCYLPRGLRWLGRGLDRMAVRWNWPGGIMAVRAEK